MYNSKYNFVIWKILYSILRVILDITDILQLPIGDYFLMCVGESVICVCFWFVLFCGVFGRKKKECICTLMSVCGHVLVVVWAVITEALLGTASLCMSMIYNSHTGIFCSISLQNFWCFKVFCKYTCQLFRREFLGDVIYT